MEWMLMPLRRYAEFSGRSRRKEYWMYVLLLLIVSLVIGFLEGALGLTGMVGPYGPLSALFLLATFVPSLAVGVRRLHDTNRTGWWMVLPIAPYLVAALLLASGNLALAGTIGMLGLLGAIVVLVFLVLDGTKGPNRYGPDPKGAEHAEAIA